MCIYVLPLLLLTITVNDSKISVYVCPSIHKSIINLTIIIINYHYYW